jgi:hypothetical protein
MKPYDAHGVCPKCGSAHVTTRFYGAVGVIRTEHIRRECSRCRYEWREAPLDHAINPDRAQIKSLSRGERLNAAAHAGFTRFPVGDD